MGQSLSRAVVHIIFSTKNRFAFLTDSERQKRMHGYHARIFNEHDSLSIDERHLGNRKGKPVSPLQGLMVLHPESQGSAALHPGLFYFALAGLNSAAP